jgi:hypothetical protein
VLDLFGARKPASDSYVPSLLGAGRFDGSSKVCGDPTCLECASRVAARLSARRLYTRRLPMNRRRYVGVVGDWARQPVIVHDLVGPQ